MQKITTIAELEALYPPVAPGALNKVATRITPAYQQWINASRFVVLSTVGTDGTDGSPRGDVEPVVEIADNTTLLLPDWRGNNRLDSLRNIVEDGRVSLMFMVPGCNNVVRVNGTAILTNDPNLTQRFDRNGKTPATVIVISVGERYFQCAKAVMRSEIWSGENLGTEIPTAGDFLKEAKEGFDGKAYDEGYSAYARERMW